jgi:hypothetical protein
MDERAASWFELIGQLNEAVLSSRIGGQAVAFGALACGYTPLDMDTFAMDNSGTHKELVGRTYAGVDGYCPIASYLGTQGYCLELALRPGVQHSARETGYDLERVVPMATRLAAGPILVRADSGFCSCDLMAQIDQQAQELGREIAFLIKWNPRATPVETIARQKTAEANAVWSLEREGKRLTVWEESVHIKGVRDHVEDAPEEAPGRVRRIYRLTERTIDTHGQKLLLPEYILEGWTTTLPRSMPAGQIIGVYADHATHEQFHSEFKTDMGLERLPSGKFDTNYLICQLAAVAMNLLRRIGQHSLHGKAAPVRHKALRRRIGTVMQEMMYKAARMIRHGRRWVLGMGHNDPAYAVFERLYRDLSTA